MKAIAVFENEHVIIFKESNTGLRIYQSMTNWIDSPTLVEYFNKNTGKICVKIKCEDKNGIYLNAVGVLEDGVQKSKKIYYNINEEFLVDFELRYN